MLLLLAACSPGPRPVPPPSAPPPVAATPPDLCEPLGAAVGRAIDAAAVCTKDADCEVRRLGTCNLPGVDCYSIHVHVGADQGPIDAAVDAWAKGCNRASMCHCAEPDHSVCRAGHCTGTP